LRPLLIPPSRLVLLAGLALTACSSIQPQAPSAGHIRAEAVAAPNPEHPCAGCRHSHACPAQGGGKAESYSVSVRNIPVQDLLFALARDAKLNVDIHPGINGIVTINAIDQTLATDPDAHFQAGRHALGARRPESGGDADSPFLRTTRSTTSICRAT
jgi:hypothetical protein